MQACASVDADSCISSNTLVSKSAHSLIRDGQCNRNCKTPADPRCLLHMDRSASNGLESGSNLQDTSPSREVLVTVVTSALVFLLLAALVIFFASRCAQQAKCHLTNSKFQKETCRITVYKIVIANVATIFGYMFEAATVL
jgi:hypothetical protein